MFPRAADLFAAEYGPFALLYPSTLAFPPMVRAGRLHENPAPYAKKPYESPFTQLGGLTTGGLKAASAWTICRDPLEVTDSAVIMYTGVLITGLTDEQL